MRTQMDRQGIRLKTEKAGTLTYYPFIDSIRGISILWVIGHHVLIFFNTQGINFIFRRFLKLGFLGVDLFFVTSGFLITGLLMEEFLEGKLRIRRFYARRFFKIVPHYFLTVVVALGIAAFLIPDAVIEPVQIFFYLTLMPSYLKKQFAPLAHLWSISIEEHFYLAYPILLCFLGKVAGMRKGRYKLVILVLCFLILGGNLSRIICFQNLHNDNNVYVYQRTHVRFDALILGCLLRFVEDRFNRRFVGGILVLCSIFILFFFFFNFSHIVWFFCTLAYLAAAALLAAGLCGFQPVVDLGRVGPLKWIGKNSYGIYLWHYILIFPIIERFGFIKTEWPVAAVYVILSIAFGVLSTLTFERFFLRLRHQWVP